MYPIIAAHGNHENREMQMVYYLFDAPNPDMYFGLNVGGDMMRLWTLNSELNGFPQKWKEQLKWFKSDLAKHQKIKWKIADYHKPMRPHTARKSEGKAMYETFANLFYKHGVDLVVESDTHMVKRTYPIRPSKEKGSSEGFIIDPKGTVYIGEGSWGAPTRPVNDDKPWTLASASFYQFKWIHVSPEKLESRVVKFKNVEKVEALTEENLLKIPNNLELWEPDTGAVLTLPFSQKNLTKNKPTIIIPSGSNWKYDDSKSSDGNSWTLPEFDDNKWKQGKSPMGYGEDNLATTLSFGSNPKQKIISARFRKTFEVKDKTNVRKIRLKVRRDDGVVIYLNGKKVVSDSMPKGDITNNTPANKLAHGSNEKKFFEFTLPGTLLKKGSNLLAVSVHQIKPTSSDLLFDLILETLK